MVMVAQTALGRHRAIRPDVHHCEDAVPSLARLLALQTVKRL
jgi:hypothetical protein